MSLCPQLCHLAFGALFENKRAPIRGRNANFQKSLKLPHNGVLKTLCAKSQVCKSIGMTSSMYRRITNYKEEDTRKWPQMGLREPEFKILKNKNKNVPRSTVPKNDVPMSKTDTIVSRSNVTWTVPFVDT